MKTNIISVSVGLITASIFLVLVLTPPSTFNLLPFSLHESLFRDVIKESSFIVMFDVLVSVIIFFLVKKLVKKLMENFFNT